MVCQTIPKGGACVTSSRIRQLDYLSHWVEERENLKRQKVKRPRSGAFHCSWRCNHVESTHMAMWI